MKEKKYVSVILRFFFYFFYCRQYMKFMRIYNLRIISINSNSPYSNFNKTTSKQQNITLQYFQTMSILLAQTCMLQWFNRHVAYVLKIQSQSVCFYKSVWDPALLTLYLTYYYNTNKLCIITFLCSCGSVVEHCVSSAKVVGLIPREHILTKQMTECTVCRFG